MDSTITAALIAAAATIAATLITIAYSKRRESTAPGAPSDASLDGARAGLTLDKILERLERYQQRATFGAVAGYLGRDPFTLFDGYPRTPRTSWVVSKTTGKPTGHSPSQTHPALYSNPKVIEKTDDLRNWLDSHT